jgi:hypothetical protein
VPLSFYFYVADLAAVSERLTAAGTPVDPAGRPQHAPGGEARLADPDGNVLLIGQRTPGRDTDADPAHAQRRFRLLHEAAAQLRRNAASTSNGDAASRCQIGQANGAACPEPAEVKLADSWGDTAWACLRHADETLISAPGAFLASQDTQGLQHFLKDRQPRS